jgi:hypothetical protein
MARLQVCANFKAVLGCALERQPSHPSDEAANRGNNMLALASRNPAPNRMAGFFFCLVLLQFSPLLLKAQNLTASPDLMLALLYQLTPLAKPVAFVTAQAFRENLLATSVTTGLAGGMLSFDSFLLEARADEPPREDRLRSS